MKQSKSHIVKSVFLLLLFLFVKLGIAHAISHEFSHNDSEECQECVLMVKTNNSFSFDNPKSLDFSLKSEEIRYSKKAFIKYKNPNVNRSFYAFSFNKPPPFNS